MHIKFYLSFVLFIIMQQCLYAQGEKYQFSHLDIANGLSNNQINCIYKDENGFMWFGTNSGLNRYDGYQFKIFKHDINDTRSLTGNYVMRMYEGPDKTMWVYTHGGLSVYNSATEKFSNDISAELLQYGIATNKLALIRKDGTGDFWFLTINNGIYCYHPKTKKVEFYSNSAKSKIKLHSNYVSDIVAGQNDIVWLIYNDGVMDELDTRNSKILLRTNSLNKANGNKPQYYSAIADKDHNLWIYAVGSTIGVYCYHTRDKELLHFGKGSRGLSLNSNVINNIVEGDDNEIWIGTDHGGINVVSLSTYKVNYLLSRYDDSRSLRGNCVVLYKDDKGIIWAGTYKQGVSYFHKGVIQFALARHYIGNSESLPYDDINCFAEDANGNLWIGTNGGGLIFFDKTTKKYTQLKYDPGNPNSLSNDIIISLCIDHKHRLWIGTYFGGLNRLDGNKFIHYRHKDDVPGSISDDRVYSIIEDSSQRLWVGTFTGGLNVFDPVADSFKHPRYAMSSDYTAVLFEDKQKNIWIGRDRGIDIIENKTGNIKHYFNQSKSPNSLLSNDVNSIFQDSRGLFWVGTKEGLSIINAQTGNFINIDERKGLPSNNVLNTLEDKNANIWISTANGLASVALIKSGDTYKYTVKKYDEFDGLQGKEYNAYAALKTKDGNMIFGGGRGYNLFDPERINTVISKPKLIFTNFQLFNKSVNVGDTVNGNVALRKSITLSKYLVLKHNENVFSLEFAACDYFNPNKINYQYKLEGFDNGWLTAPKNSPKATYTNLDAGDYVFRVRASNTNSPGNFGVTTINIKILPPFWKSGYAYLFYVAITIIALVCIRHRGIAKIKRRFELKQAILEAEQKVVKEREQARRMHDLDLMKIKFFTSVSHEFRTPLSLIISPIDNLIKNIDKPEQQQQLIMIKRNGKRLLNLVNQLLDFRKMEFRELKLNLSKADIVHFIKDVSSSFTDIADQNHIRYLFDSEIDSLITQFDQDKIERVLFNLLSNAFKFTSPGGHISVFVGLAGSDLNADEAQLLEIRIMDTGIGIAEEKLEKIFERFFQDNLPEGLLNQGSGIGLSISREFVKMHNGEIYVESEPGNGSCFIIRLPVSIECDKSPVVQIVNKHLDNIPVAYENTFLSAKKPLVLLIEDNEDMRFYLKDNLKHNFSIIDAVNGKDGWQKTLSLHPDLIVSDVSMPEMSGIELCNKIRHDSRTAHIPVILLTALIEEDAQLAGTLSGANDYITKPFSFEILLSKINGLLQMQQTLKKTYQKQLEIQVQDINIISEDQKFLNNTLACIEKNITNHNFSVEELSRQMSLSRVSLYKRLLTLTGKTPVDCIRTIRLKRAVQLLEKSQLSIANISYEVGFNNPTYFSKVFKDEYGILPSEFINEIRKKEKQPLERYESFV